MPSIEIVCVRQVSPTGFGRLPFAVESGMELKSHRVPRPRFQRDLAALRGCIYHIGNPDLRSRRAGRVFFAWDLLSVRSRSAAKYLEFKPVFVLALQDLLGGLIEASPARELLFTSDWQFGPPRSYRSPAITLRELWSLHDSYKLRLNAAYPVHG